LWSAFIGIIYIVSKRFWVEWKTRLKFSLHDRHSYHSIPHSSIIYSPITSKGVLHLPSSLKSILTRLFKEISRVLFASTSNLEGMSILIVEATIMRQGIYQAIHSKFKDIVIDRDNKIIIQTVCGEISVSWSLHTL